VKKSNSCGESSVLKARIIVKYCSMMSISDVAGGIKNVRHYVEQAISDIQHFYWMNTDGWWTSIEASKTYSIWTWLNGGKHY
jgi:hypothetical protein